MRIKTGTVRHRKHSKLLSRTKGYRMTKNRLYKVAKEASLHADQYAYAGRRIRKRDLRKLWIIRLNAALVEQGLTYSRFIDAANKAKIKIDRKVLASLAVGHPEVFKAVISQVQKD